MSFPTSETVYRGGAFHPQLPDTGAVGNVRLTFTGLCFESDALRLELPLDGLVIRLGGGLGDRVLFTHPAAPAVMIHTGDRAVLDHPVIRRTPPLQAQVRRGRGRSRLTAAVLLAFIAIVVGGIITVFAARDRLVAKAAATVPPTWETSTGDVLLEQAIAARRIISDPAVAADLKVITERLEAAIEHPLYPLRFHIIEDPTLNAFALPGGNMVIHSGLLLAAESPEEVAGVLAHEIAHVTQRHAIRNIISSAGLYAMWSALVGDATGIVGVIGENSAFLLNRKFSRDFEREADDAGWELLVRAQIAPTGMIAFFEKLEREHASAPGVGALDVFSTHPATRDRIERLQRRADAATTATRPITLDYAACKARLKALLPN